MHRDTCAHKPNSDCSLQAASVEQQPINKEIFESVSSGVENISLLIGCCLTLAG